MMAAIPPLLVALIQPEGGLTLVLMVAIGYVAVNIFLGNFIEPALMGQQLGLSTLVVFVSLVFWGWVLGPVGMLLSVPLTMVVKILLENSAELRWIAVLLDKSPGPRPEAAT
jgi:predicted PurR-regulated permease PerM